MARLPQVGGDSGSWGDVLNDFLRQAHSDDGALRTNSVGAPQIKPGAVTGAALADETIDEVKLTTAVREKLNAPMTIADASVTTSKIAAMAVTPQKVTGFGTADGFATLGADGRLSSSQVPERLTEAGLTAAIAAELKLRGSETIVLGDSIDAQTGGWFARLCVSSSQRVTYYRNAGVGGERTDQHRVRLVAWCHFPRGSRHR